MMRRRGGIVRMAATTAVVAGTAGAVSHHQQQKYAAAGRGAGLRAAAGRCGRGSPAAAVRSTPGARRRRAPEDPQMAQLQKLADLHTAGILSDEEFAAAKAKALGI